jgi:hypothetical protein
MTAEEDDVNEELVMAGIDPPSTLLEDFGSSPD